MAVCNLFRKLSKPTGEFLMFSQYAEDLTRNNSQGYNYRVSPSRFIAANIDFSKLNKYTDKDLNESFPMYLQNYFENGCAVCKNNNIEWTPEISSNLFWNAMINGGLLTFTDEEIPSNSPNKSYKHYVNEFKWMGDINIQSYDVMSGMGYSEIYCYIPNSAQSIRYGCSSVNMENPIPSTNNFIEGYKADEIGEELISGSIESDVKYYYKKSIEFYHDKKEYGIDLLDDDKFIVNCIIVLYDINNIDNEGNSNTIYKNIPLGIYLPGCFSENKMTNEITKWVHNSDIYNSGTSYGIRICSRFSVAPNSDNIKEIEVKSINPGEYQSLSQVMGGIADNIQGMMEITKDAVFESKSLKDTLAIFKNSRTNVPYIVELNGLNYWFINGRNTGIIVPDGTPYDPYTDDEIKNAILLWDGVDATLVLNVYTVNNLGEKEYTEKIYPTGDQPQTDILVRWSLINKYTLESITPDKLILKHPDESTEELDPNIETFIIKNVTKDGRYELKATWMIDIDGNITENELVGTLDLKFCLPIWFGLVSGTIGEKTGTDSTSDVIDSILNGAIEIYNVPGMNKYVLPTESNRVQFISNGKRIVYAYPSEYGPLESILNRNSMDESIHDFETTTIKVGFEKDGSKEFVDYNIYYTSNNTGNNIEVAFDFMNSNEQINDTINY